LVEDWAFLAQRPITSFALRLLNSAGRLWAEELDIEVDP
jgi:hypothetical protein